MLGWRRRVVDAADHVVGALPWTLQPGVLPKPEFDVPLKNSSLDGRIEREHEIIVVINPAHCVFVKGLTQNTGCVSV